MTTTGFYIFLLYNLSYFLHLTSRVPVLGSIRFEKIIVMCLIACLFFVFSKKRNKEPDDISKKFKIFFIYILISLPLVKWPGSVFHDGFEYFFKAIIFFIFTVAFVDSGKKIKILISIFLGCQLFRIVEPGYLHLTEGYWGSAAYSMTGGELSHIERLSSAPTDVLNPTQFAGLIITVIPFFYFLLWKSQKKMLKIFFLCMSPVSLYVLFLTGARSGLICLLIVVFSIKIFESGQKIKLKTILYSIIIIIPLLFISFQVLPPEITERYMSLIDSSAKGHDTVVGRMSGLKGGFGELLTPRIIFGYGLGTSAEANYLISGSARPSHSLYIETIQELGIIGMILFATYIQSIFKSLTKARQRLEEDINKYEWNLNLVKAIQAWAAMFLVYSIICFGLRSWEWYFFGGLSTVSLKIASQNKEEKNR